jgi:NAD(P)-dependent dehydrogenase (short-subunit alcohol dehydrogenase family)
MFGLEREPESKAGVEEVDLSGTRVLVTGSTSGLGREAALSLGRLGADVIVHGRRAAPGEETVEELETLGSDAAFVSADFQDPEAVSSLADRVEESVGELDVLCNNAGGLFEDDAETDLGVGRTFHINHLAPYQLTAELLETLSDGARVITTASIGHRLATLNLDRLAEWTGLSPWAAYCRSKLMNILFANELARRLVADGRDITSNSLHPGVIPGSEFSRSLPSPAPEIGKFVGQLPMTDSVEDGAATIVYLAAADEVEGVTGTYYARCTERRPAPDARDVAAQRSLWERSAELLDIEEPLAAAVDDE